MTDPDCMCRVARAMHEADNPVCDWAQLPLEDSSFGIGKDRRLRMARAALHEMNWSATIMHDHVEKETNIELLEQRLHEVILAARACQEEIKILYASMSLDEINMQDKEWKV